MNNLTGLNLSGQTYLKYLDCSNNLISGININNCYNLTGLNLKNNNLSGELNLSEFKNLTQIDVSNNRLSGINVTGLNKLTTFQADNNRITGLDFFGATNVKIISASGNSMTRYSNIIDNMTGLVAVNLAGNNLINPGTLLFWLTGYYGTEVFAAGIFKL